MPLAVGLFLRTYGAAAFLGPGWPTRTGQIPWGLFWQLYSEIPAVQALERVNAAAAMASGIGLAFGADEARRLVQRELETALGAGRVSPAGDVALVQDPKELTHAE